MMILENSSVKLSQKKNNIGLDTISTLINIGVAKGYSFSSEFEIANYINKEYNLNISSDDVAKLFELQRCEEDAHLIYQNFLNY